MTDINQSLRQASVRGVTGTTYNYEGDWSALFDLAGIPAGTWNERMFLWIVQQTAQSFTTLTEAMQAYAVSLGVGSWNELGAFTPGSTGGSTGIFGGVFGSVDGRIYG